MADSDTNVKNSYVPPNFVKKPRTDDFRSISSNQKVKLLNTADVARIIGVNERTVRVWRTTGIFLEDVLDHKGNCFYYEERVLQLKSVYHKGWDNIYKSETGRFSSSFIADIKSRWQELLPHDKSGKGAICPNCGAGSGKHGTGISPVKNSFELKCFSCGESHDVIGWICLQNGWNITTDFIKAVEFCANQLNIPLDDLCKAEPQIAHNASETHEKVSKNAVQLKNDKSTIHPKNAPKIDFKTPSRDLLNYYKECNARLDQTDYWVKRGLSRETCDHFLVGFDPQWRHSRWASNAKISPRLIVPISTSSYLARDVRSASELKTQFERDKLKVKDGPINSVFNPDAIDSDIVFVVEGEIDAMSIYDVGFHNVVALGSIAYVNKFLDLVSNAVKRPHSVIISLDNEQKRPVIAAKKKLIDALAKLGVNSLDGSDLSGDCKDPNELLIVDRQQLKSNCEYLLEQATELPALNAVVVASQKKSQKKTGHSDLTGSISTKQVINSCPVDFKIPNDCSFTANGVFVNDVCACRCPVVPTKHITNHRIGSEKFAIAIRRRNGTWKEIIADAVTIADSSKIIDLANFGLRTSSGEAARALVYYLRDTIALNEADMPDIEEFEQPGWSSDYNQFRLPYLGDYYMPAVSDIYTQRGTLDEWIAFTNGIAKKSIIARIMLGVSFAAPLLRILGQRSFGVYLYGNSLAGKSTCQRLAISAWGNPDKMMGTFHTTINGLESIAVRSNDLPLLIDESTVADQKVFDFEKLNYFISSEISKIRMDRNLNERPRKQWRLPVLMNGEGSIFTTSSHAGAMNRVLELALAPDEVIFDSELDAADAAHFVDEHHGTAGAAFIQALMAYRYENFNIVRGYYSIIFDQLKDLRHKYQLEHIRLAAIIATGDAFRYSFFCKDQYLNDSSDQKVKDFEASIIPYALDVAFEILRRIPNRNALSEEHRAWTAFVSHIQAHKRHFLGDHLKRDPFDDKADPPLTPIKGKFVTRLVSADEATESGDASESGDEHTQRLVLDEIQILTEQAKKILIAEGFASPQKFLRSFAEHGLIRSDDNTFTVMRRWDGTRQRLIVIPGHNFTPDYEE